MATQTIKKPSFIQNASNRGITACKRKRGIFKKAIELSSLCGLEVFLVIFDAEYQVLYEMKSQEDFDSQVVSHMLDKTTRQQFKFKQFTSDDYAEFSLEKNCKQNYSFLDESDQENENHPN